MPAGSCHWLMRATILAVALGVQSAHAQTCSGNGQSGFDACMATALQPGADEAVDITIGPTAGTVIIGENLSLPGVATGIQLNFNAESGQRGSVFVNNGARLAIGDGADVDFTGNTNLYIVTATGETGSMEMTGGTLAFSNPDLAANLFSIFSVGYGGTASVAQSSGEIFLEQSVFQLGVQGGTGTYDLSGGSFSMTRGISTIYVGSSGGTGTINVTGDGQFKTESTSGVDLSVGRNGGTGRIVQDGAGSLVSINAVSNPINVGIGAGAQGTYDLRAGTFNVTGTNGIVFGADADAIGTFLQSGGTFTADATSPVVIGQDGEGSYNISGGTSVINGGLHIASGSGSGNVFQSGGVVTLNGAPIEFGPGMSRYELTGGTLAINTANPFTVNPSGNYNFVLGSGTILALTDFMSSIDMDGYELMQATFDSNGYEITLNGRLVGLGSIKFTGGGTVVLNGANSFDAPAVLDDVTVVVGHETALGASFTHFLSDSTLQFAANYTLANEMVIETDVIAAFDTNGNTGTLNGIISGAGALKKDGDGTLILNAANTYSGGTWVAGGTLQLGTGASLATTTRVQVDSGATFDVNDNTQIIAALYGSGTVDIGTGLLAVGGNNESTAFSGTVSMTNQGYQSPYGRFAKIGTGTLTIDNATFALGETYIQQGKMAQTSGDTSVTYLAVGTGTDGGTPNVGGLDVSGGTITFGTALQVGDWGGTGTVNQTGGTVQLTAECGDTSRCSAMNIGNQGGNGTYNISGGSLNLTGWLNTIGRNTGTNAASSGTLNISGDGVVDLSNNGVDPSRLIVGLGNADAGQPQSQGTINQTGGTLRIHDGSTLNVGGQNDALGIYNLLGGTLEIGGTAALVAGFNNANANYEFNFGAATIKVIEASLTTGISAMLLPGGSTIDTNGFAATWNGVLSGTGALLKAGDGTLLLNGANTYSGGTRIDAGALQLGIDGALASSGAVQVASGATLDINDHTQTIGALYGAGIIDIGAGAFTTDSAASTTFSGSMTGTGSFEKRGGGTLYLTGDSDYTGATILDGGALVVNGSLASQVTVESGTLGGNGTLGGLIITGNGIAAPGNSIGTIHVNGIVVFDPQSTYHVEVGSAGHSDLISATGTATLNGGNVVVSQSGNTVSLTTPYTIVSAAGGRQGTFDGVSSSFAFLTPSLSYDANNVYLTLALNGREFIDAARTRDQRAVARALDLLPTNNPLFQTILTGSEETAEQAFNALDGEVHASAASVLAMNSFYVRNAIFSRLIQSHYSAPGGSEAPFAAASPATVAMLDRGSRMSLGGGLDDLGTQSMTPGRDLAFWTRGFGAWGTIDGNGDSAGVDRTLGGFISGADARLGGGWRAGLATGYMRSDMGVGARASSADIDSYVLAGYAGGAAGPFAIRSGAAWMWSNVDTARSVFFPGFFEAEQASYGADTGQLFGEIAYPVIHATGAWEPFASLSYIHVGTDGFTESGQQAGLSSGGADNNIGVSLLGLRAGTTLPAYGMLFTPHGTIAWQYAFGDVNPEQAFAFASTGIGFGIVGAPIARSSALIEAGLDVSIAEDAFLGLTYTGQLASDVNDNSVQGRFNWRF